MLWQLLSKHGKHCLCRHAGRSRGLRHSCTIRLKFLVQSDNTSATETKIVLKAYGCAFDLPCSGFSAQLPAYFSTLSKAGGAQGMAFRDKAARWVHNPFAAIGNIAFHNELSGLASGAQAEAFVSDEFVGREAVVKFDDLNVLRFDACHGVGSGSCALSHA